MVKQETRKQYQETTDNNLAQRRREFSEPCSLTNSQNGNLQYEEIPIEDVWRQYKQSLSEEARNLLIKNYYPLVLNCAKRRDSRIPMEIDIMDLVQEGTIGLMKAINQFDLSRKTKFETYAQVKINGAILDYLREQDFLPRKARARYNTLKRAKEKIEKKCGEATIDEIKQKIRATNKEFDRILKDGTIPTITSLERGTPGETYAWSIPDSKIPNPEIEPMKKDLREAITKGCSPQEKLILILHYYENMSHGEVGIALNLSKSRVSQIHSSLLARLREKLGGSARKKDLVEIAS